MLSAYSFNTVQAKKILTLNGHLENLKTWLDKFKQLASKTTLSEPSPKQRLLRIQKWDEFINQLKIEEKEKLIQQCEASLQKMQTKFSKNGNQGNYTALTILLRQLMIKKIEIVSVFIQGSKLIAADYIELERHTKNNPQAKQKYIEEAYKYIKKAKEFYEKYISILEYGPEATVDMEDAISYIETQYNLYFNNNNNNFSNDSIDAILKDAELETNRDKAFVKFKEAANLAAQRNDFEAQFLILCKHACRYADSILGLGIAVPSQQLNEWFSNTHASYMLCKSSLTVLNTRIKKLAPKSEAAREIFTSSHNSLYVARLCYAMVLNARDAKQKEQFLSLAKNFCELCLGFVNHAICLTEKEKQEEDEKKKDCEKLKEVIDKELQDLKDSQKEQGEKIKAQELQAAELRKLIAEYDQICEEELKKEKEERKKNKRKKKNLIVEMEVQVGTLLDIQEEEELHPIYLNLQSKRVRYSRNNPIILEENLAIIKNPKNIYEKIRAHLNVGEYYKVEALRILNHQSILTSSNAIDYLQQAKESLKAAIADIDLANNADKSNEIYADLQDKKKWALIILEDVEEILRDTLVHQNNVKERFDQSRRDAKKRILDLKDGHQIWYKFKTWEELSLNAKIHATTKKNLPTLELLNAEINDLVNKTELIIIERPTSKKTRGLYRSDSCNSFFDPNNLQRLAYKSFCINMVGVVDLGLEEEKNRLRSLAPVPRANR